MEKVFRKCDRMRAEHEKEIREKYGWLEEEDEEEKEDRRERRKEKKRERLAAKYGLYGSYASSYGYPYNGPWY